MDHFIYEKTKDGEGVYDIYSKLLQDRIIFLYEEIDTEVASRIIASLLYLNKKSRTREIIVYINSPGGETEGFLAIYDMFQFISAPIKTICIGEACSAAADLLASGSAGKRLILPNAKVMIHSIQADISGSNKEVMEEVTRLKELHSRSIEILARHTRQPFEKVAKDVEHDKWLTAEEALEYGIVDKILQPKKKIPPLKTSATKTTKKTRARKTRKRR